MTNLVNKQVINLETNKIYKITKQEGGYVFLEPGSKIKISTLNSKFKIVGEETKTKNKKKSTPLNENQQNFFDDSKFSAFKNYSDPTQDPLYQRAMGGNFKNFNQTQYNNYQQPFEENQYNFQQNNHTNNHANNDFISNLEKEFESLNDNKNNFNYKAPGNDGYNEDYIRRKNNFNQNHNEPHNQQNFHQNNFEYQENLYEEPIKNNNEDYISFESKTKNTTKKKKNQHIKEEINNIPEEIQNEIFRKKMLDSFKRDYKYKLNLEIIEHSLSPDAILFMLNYNDIDIINEIADEIVDSIITEPLKLKNIVMNKLKYEININKTEEIDVN